MSQLIHLYIKTTSISHIVGICYIFVEPVDEFLLQFKEIFLRVGGARW